MNGAWMAAKLLRAAATLLLAVTVVAANLVVDVLSAWLNPRLHAATGA